MLLDQREIEAVAALATDPAYQLLLSKIESLIDGVTQALHTEPKKTDQLLPYWRALKDIHAELKYTPEELLKVTNYKEETIDAPPNRRASQQLTEYLTKLIEQKKKNAL